MSRNAKNTIKILVTLAASLDYSFNWHQARRLIEFSRELLTLRSVDLETKNHWANIANCYIEKMKGM